VGKEVATLVDEVEDAGHKQVRFDAGNLASGIYYYRLSADKFSVPITMGMKKMIIVK